MAWRDRFARADIVVRPAPSSPVACRVPAARAALRGPPHPATFDPSRPAATSLARPLAQAERHRRAPGPVRHRPGRREEDPRGRRLRALPQDRPHRPRRRRAQQEQHPAHRRVGHRQDAHLRDALARGRRALRHRRGDLACQHALRQRGDRGDAAAPRREGPRRRRPRLARDRLHRRDRQAQVTGRPRARQFGRVGAAFAAQDHGRRAGQARQRRLRRHHRHPLHLRWRLRRARRHHRLANARLRLHRDHEGRQPAHPRPAQFTGEADRPLHLRAHPGVHRSAADRRALPRSRSGDDGANHDRTTQRPVPAVPGDLP